MSAHSKVFAFGAPRDRAATPRLFVQPDYATGLSGTDPPAYDARTGETLPLQGTQFQVDLGPLGWRLVRVVLDQGAFLLVR